MRVSGDFSEFVCCIPTYYSIVYTQPYTMKILLRHYLCQNKIPAKPGKCEMQNATKLRTADCRLLTADCRLLTADCRLPTADCRLPTFFLQFPGLSLILS